MTARRQIIEEIIPVTGVRMRFRTEDTVESVRLEPGGHDLDFEVDGSEIVVSVPDLDVHSMIVIRHGKAEDTAADPAWYDERWRRLILEFDHGDSSEYLTDLDAAALAKTVADSGVDMIWIDARGNGGTLLHETRAGTKHPNLGERDFIREFTSELAARDVEYGFYFNMSRDGWSYARHPEWRQLWHDGTPRGGGPINPNWENMCHNSPHREYNYALIRELVEGYGPSAMWLDRFDWGGVLPDSFTCTCPYCTAKFEVSTGYTMPTRVDWESEGWRAFVRWRSQILTDYFIEVREFIRGIDDSVSVCLNTHNGLDMFGTWFHGQDVETLMQAADHIAQEIHYEREGYLGHALIPRFTRAASGGRPMEALSFRHAGGEVDFAIKPAAQLEVEAAGLIANGCAPLWDDMVYPQGVVEPAVYEALAPAFDFVRSRKPWLGGESVPWAAVMFSKDTRLFYGREHMAERYLLEFLGSCQSLLEAHLPFDIITDSGITAESLSRYSVLVLPNTACLDDDQVDVIEQFVKAGGGLVATGDSGTRDRDGRPRSCTLFDLMGVDAVEPFSLTPVYFRFDDQDAQRTGLTAGLAYPHRAPIGKVRAKGDAVVVGRVARGREGLNRLSHFCHPPAAENTDYAASVRNSAGDGRTVYFPGMPATVFAQWGHTHGKQLLVQAVREAARDEPFVQIEAPLCVEVTAFRHADRGETVVHLVNMPSNQARSWEIMTDRFVI